MNYILQLTGFFQRVATDDRLNPTHVSLYMAIFQFWNVEHFHNPVTITRQELMEVSKISSKATYHKCIKDLNNFGYIKYAPSYNPFKGSQVYLFDFQSATVPNFDTSRTKIETSTELALVPSLKQYKQENIERENTRPKNDTVVFDSKEKIKGNLSESKIKKNPKEKREKRGAEIPPKLEDVLNFFSELKSSDVEANKFFNHFQSNGWKVGGRAQMKDWKAAARNWMLNVPEFSRKPGNKPQNNPTPGSLTATTNKNYSEPL